MSNLEAWTEIYFLEHKDILAMQILTLKGKGNLQLPELFSFQCVDRESTWKIEIVELGIRK